MRRRLCELLGVLCLCAVFLAPSSARAGSGYYYGAHFGFFDFFEDKGPFSQVDGGYTFGPKAGAYFISGWLALALDISASVGLVGEDLDFWTVDAPTVSIAIGTGFDAFMLYAGGAFSLVGLDNFNDSLRASMLNPYAFGGLQLGYGGFIARGEFQIGQEIRINGDNYAFTNIQITIGYGLYADFL